MEVELVTDDTSEDENYGFDDNNEDYLNFEGERCGICSDTVIDRGVLDCCQHWFCFTCIDNWATITSLCPLCQNEFQLITCVPVYDTVGGNKTDDDTGPRDDDWFIEEKNNTLSFPSYYIDENAVICLDGDDCKIRSGIVAVEEDSDIDTSIACDLCDKWYHAFCVGFDPEGTSNGSWLCPRCTADTGPQKLDRVLELRKSYQSSFEISNGDSLAETSFSGRVLVSLADEGETAVVVSLVNRNQGAQKSSESFLGCGEHVDNPLLSDPVSDMLQSEVLLEDEPKSGQQVMGLSLSEDNCIGPSHSMSPIHPKMCADDSVERAPMHLNSTDCGLNMGLGLSMDSDTCEFKYKDIIEDHVPESVEEPCRSEDPLSAENMEPNRMEVISPKSLIADDKETISGLIGIKRKQTDSSDAHGNVDDGEREANTEVKISRKKTKAERNSKFTSQMDETSVLEESHTISRSSSRDGKVRCAPEKGKGISIMDIVQGTDPKSLKQLRQKNSSSKSTKEGESAAGLRLKKIMRRAGNGQDSSVLVQEIRQKLREAVRNKSSDDHRQNLFDPKLLDAFRTALAGSGAESRKPTLDVKAKKALLQKGKVRESLTKKIYGAGGKRRRAWTRECEVEFWKHRCTQATKPEKIQTLKSVLDLLRVNSDSGKKIPEHDEEPKGSILSRLYLADSSVFPRNNDIQPVSALNAVSTSEQKRQSGATEKVVLPVDQSDRIPQKQSSESQVVVPPVDDKDKKTIKGMKTENASVETHRKRDSVGARTPALGGINSSDKNVASNSGDRRKWAMELLARKTATSGKNTQDEDDDPTILKGNYPLLAQLPKDMRPVLASARHNKIPVSVRQAQLYHLAEHFLKKANLSTVCKTAETELAVADAVNIENQIADKSNSKIVYLNMCSQEIRRRPDNVDSNPAKESNPSLESERPPDNAGEENNDSSFDLDVDDALRKAGLMEDSPSNSPNRPTEGAQNETSSSEKIDEEGPDNIFEVDSHPELDIYGDFEYNLEDDDFIGAGSLNISNHQQEPKIKLLFSSLNPEKPNENLDLPNHDFSAGVETKAVAGSSGLLDSLNITTTEGGSTLDRRVDNCNFRNSSGGDNDEEPSLAECEELYGPDKEPLVQKFPETLSVTPIDLSFKKELLPGKNGDSGCNHAEKTSGQTTKDSVESSQPTTDGSKQPSSKKKTAKSDSKQSEPNGEVMKKVEAYIKEHIRPLCKSGVITVDQYRWAVGKTTEKVMKYHSKEKNANFLIKEGEKVKKLAEQYVEAAPQKAKT